MADTSISAGRAGGRSRLLGARALIVLASVLLVLSILGTWVRAQIIDTKGWTRTSVQLLHNEKVRTAVSGAISERLLAVLDARELAANKLPSALAPLAGALSSAAAEFVPQAVDRALASPPVQEAWGRANELAHGELIRLLDGGGPALSTSGGVVSIDLSVLLDKIGARLGIGDEIGAKLPPARRRLVLLRSKQLKLAQDGVKGLRDLSVLLPALVVLCYLMALGFAVGRRRTALLEIGAGIVLAGLASLLLHRFVESYVTENLVKSEGLRPAVREALAILTASWQSRAIWTLVTGAVVVLAAVIAGPARWARSLRDRIAPSLQEHTAWFAGGAVAVVLLIAALGPVRTPGQTLPLLVELVLAIVGIYALRSQVRREALPEPAPAEQTGPPDDGDDAGAKRANLLMGGGALGILILVIALIAVDANGHTTPPPTPTAASAEACNGLASLCSRRLDQVVFPATHNSFSASDEGFRAANQPTGISTQLAGGIRGLLIDTHIGVQTSKGVYTVLSQDQKSREKVLNAVGPALTATALGIRAAIGYRGGGEQKVYLCHAFCEIGETPAVKQMEVIRDFLEAHPDEVLLISVEDDAAPKAFAEVVEQSGLLPYVWKGSLEPLPTLGQMVAQDERVVFMVENEPGDVPWLHAQFSISQETPYDFKKTAEVLGTGGCAANRGGTTPPLFLINNFIDTFPPSKAGAMTLNQRATIVAHARTCEAQRHRVPTLIAVDQWQLGDVVGAARELNEAGPEAGA